MSKESKSRDRFRQSIEAVRDRPADWCRGCGLAPTDTGVHRPDCPVMPAPLSCSHSGCDETRPAGAHTPMWGFDPRHGYLCPTHRKAHR